MYILTLPKECPGKPKMHLSSHVVISILLAHVTETINVISTAYISMWVNKHVASLVSGIFFKKVLIVAAFNFVQKINNINKLVMH